MTRARHALAAYLAITLVATWPLAGGLARDVAWDLGDSILNMWILAWDAEQIRGVLVGEWGRTWNFFDANIFYPAPLTLAYSEHLLPQALQILPVLLVSDNPILAYNLLFLSTFVLSGLGMYLLVRELTGQPAAGLVAGLVFAFAPYRLAQASHVQVLSAQWMPFAFYGFVRYFRSADLSALAGAAGALALQGLSSGYYLLYFTPFAAAFVLWEIAQRRLWRQWSVWLATAGAAAVVAAVTLPFLLPYAALRAEGFGVRSLTETSRFSADVYSYLTAFPEQRIWGSLLQVMPKPEGELFPGLVPIILATIGIVAGVVGSRIPDPGFRTPDPGPGRVGPRWLTWLLAAGTAGHLAAAALALLLRRVNLDMGLFVLRMSNIDRLLVRAAVTFGLLLLVSPTARRRVAAFMRDRGFFVVGLLTAAWLSLGPVPQSLGRPLEVTAPYRLLFDHLPGFDGLRVPARMAMVVVFMLSVVAGHGAAILARARAGRRALVVLGAIFLLEATHVPFIVNGMTPVREYNTPEARLHPPDRAPAVYHAMARQPAGGVVVELPLGQPDFDLRAMYYSTVHRRPMLNGYSGFVPPHYGRLTAALSQIPRHPDVSVQALGASGATHVILHEGAYRGNEGADTAAVLRQAGAVEIFRDGADVLYRLETGDRR
ncbi:MAG: hypothetical protein A3G77_16185 [Acidobacteria bacterium RIFCSPLOWO2_12_FULL_68_19]|nr:MAG: hypothetical protein A3G77_16185 [Acidobacteria bacterium RIFCSPLOWO2_12_FULL_68_19]